METTPVGIEPTDAIQKVREIFEHQATSPPRIGGQEDVAIQEFSAAMVDALQDCPPIQQRLEEVIEKKHSRGWEFGPQEAAKALEKAIGADARGLPGFPWTDRESWDRYLAEVLCDKERAAPVFNAMEFFNVGTDIETRAAGPKLLAHALAPHRVQDPADPLSIICGGSARNHMLAMLQGNLLFSNVKVTDEVNERGIAKNYHPRHSSVVNRWLNSALLLGDSYGIDLWPIEDSEWAAFLRSCRYSYSEINDAAKTARYDHLEAVRDASPNIHHLFGNIADPNPGANLYVKKPNTTTRPVGDEELGEKDIAVLSTVLYQNTAEKRAQIIENFIGFLRPGGLLIVQDFVKVLPVSGTEQNPADQLEFLTSWYDRPFLYTTAVYDTARPEDGFNEVAKWNNGRCEQLLPQGRLLGALATTTAL